MSVCGADLPRDLLTWWKRCAVQLVRTKDMPKMRAQASSQPGERAGLLQLCIHVVDDKRSR